MPQQRTYALLFLFIFVVALSIAWQQPPALDDLRNFVFDTFQRVDPPAYDPASPIRVVTVDEASLAEVGQWPWPRTRMAALVDRLRGMGAAAIVFDIVFAEPDRASLENVLPDMPAGPLKDQLARDFQPDQGNDPRLARAIAGGPVVLGTTLEGAGEPRPWPAKAGFAIAGDPPEPFIPLFRSAALPLPVLVEAAAGLGATNWLPDRDGVVRRVPLLARVGDATMPSLALEALRVAQGASTFVLRSSNASGSTAFGAQTGMSAIRVGDIEIATGGNGSIRPRYTRTDPRRFIPAADVLAGRTTPEAVSGRIVFVGTTAIGLGDVRATPLDAVVPGVEIHAQVLEQLLTGRLLSRPDWALGAEIALTLLCLAALAVTLPRFPPLFGAIAALAVILLLVAGAWVLFDRYALLIDPSFPSLTIGVAFLSGASLLWQREQRAKRQVRAAFGKFVAPAVVARIAENPRLLVLSGETRELTILFSDLRSFSTISEGLEAHQVAQFLNAYLTPMTDVILSFEGTVDKYIGDAIVAFWNAPLDVPDHPRRAVDAALAMRTALAQFNADQARRAQLDGTAARDVKMGIGLNVGACSVGNMGSVQRFDYSALGDPVNVAARLEGVTKSYGVDVLATVAVRERTPDYAWLEVDEVKVKGRSTPTKLLTLFGDPEVRQSPAFQAWAARHDAMVAADRAGQARAAGRTARTLASECDPRWRPLYESLAALYDARSGPVSEVDEVTSVAHRDAVE